MSRNRFHDLVGAVGESAPMIISVGVIMVGLFFIAYLGTSGLRAQKLQEPPRFQLVERFANNQIYLYVDTKTGIEYTHAGEAFVQLSIPTQDVVED